MCDGLGRQFSYTCPNATLFQQRMLICDHWYMVNCSKAIDDYSANYLIGQQDKPFVEDSENNPYRRTPRPDLLHQPSASEYDIIYRTGRARNNQTNIIGADVDNDTVSTTNQPTYSLPSHWSTQIGKDSASTTTISTVPKFFQTHYSSGGNKIKGKSIEHNTNVKHQNGASDTNVKTKFNHIQSTSTPFRQKITEFATQNSVKVNFQSNFKATTPVYPKTVEASSVPPDQIGLLPPLPYIQNNTVSNPVKVNFASNFTATTPVYPTSVEPTSPDPNDVGLLPPQSNNTTTNNLKNIEIPTLSLDIVPPQFTDDYKTRNNTEISVNPPSKFYQPPKFEPDFTQQTNPIKNSEETNKDNINRRTASNGFNSGEWENLRKKFLIPDYEFPLDAATRPSYDSSLSSFRENSTKNR